MRTEGRKERRKEWGKGVKTGGGKGDHDRSAQKEEKNERPIRKVWICGFARFHSPQGAFYFAGTDRRGGEESQPIVSSQGQ
jgi:hypothetical protein